VGDYASLPPVPLDEWEPPYAATAPQTRRELHHTRSNRSPVIVAIVALALVGAVAYVVLQLV
jgi:hypothetical protein